MLNYLWIENLTRLGKFRHDLTKVNTLVAFDKVVSLKFELNKSAKLLAVGCILGEKGFSQCRFFINQGGLILVGKQKYN